MSEQRAVKAYMVAAGKYHDIDHARLELLKLLAEDERIRVQVATDYHDLEAIGESDFLITYTCDHIPTDDEQLALRDYVASGKSWFALHGTNAITRFL
ncbi:MAG: ThuA domain-containing protein, partial [Gammaproteobacteria bacterium]|nr:ThuA domain-containing protein [Gammaproteobacteria bacterium]